MYNTVRPHSAYGGPPPAPDVLFVEQTTAEEMIIFVLLAVLFALLLAFLLYGLILSFLWHGHLRSVTSFRRLLFPTRTQLREYLGEYSLAAVTSVLLTITVAARHEAVNAILEYRIADLPVEVFRESFPTGGVEPDDFMPEDTAPDSLALAYSAALTPGSADAATRSPALNLPVEVLLSTMVRAGQPDRASPWLRLAVQEGALNPQRGFPQRSHMIAVAILLLIGYTSWYAWQRSRKVEKSGRAPDSTEYGEVARRLLAPAVCLALLLISAGIIDDVERAADTAAARAAILPAGDAEEEEAVARLSHAMRRQVQRARRLDEVPSFFKRVSSRRAGTSHDPAANPSPHITPHGDHRLMFLGLPNNFLAVSYPNLR